MKATTSQTPLNGTKIDRRTRASPSSASRSPASLSSRSPVRPQRSRSRTRSRSPHRAYRGSKRRRDDEFDDRRFRREPPPPSRRFGPRYDGGYYDRRAHHARPGSHYDYDRDDGYGGTLNYSDDYRRREKRPRTRSRSPLREVRRPRKYSGDEPDARRARSTSRDRRRRRSSSEQSVSGRVNSPAAAQTSKRDAETRENQVQQDSSDAAPRGVDRYGSFGCFFMHSS